MVKRIFCFGLMFATAIFVWAPTPSPAVFYNLGPLYVPKAAPPPFVPTAWTAMSSSGAPSARDGHTAVWTGSKMMVWGGRNLSGDLADGGIYDPSTNSWSSMTNSGAPAGRTNHTAIWTGSKMIVWGGGNQSGVLLGTGAAYDLAGNSWTPISTTNAPDARHFHFAFWTGSKMLIWGGANSSNMVGDGAAYDPSTDTWSPLSNTGAPTARALHVATWTGSKMIIWGGSPANGSAHLDSGGVYDPIGDSWTATTTTSAPSARIGSFGIWTGARFLIWGGADGPAASPTNQNTGGLYDPVGNSWSSMTTSNAPTGRFRHSYGGLGSQPPIVWTGTTAILWGGCTYAYTKFPSCSVHHNTGGIYDPAGNSWVATPASGAPSARSSHTMIWTGSKVIVWGGVDSSNVLGDGAILN